MISKIRRLLARRALSGRGADARLLRYTEHAFARRGRMPLHEVRFVVFDTEATGLDIETNRMLSLAAVAVRNGAIDLSDRLELTFEADHVGGRAAAEIHQMVTADLRDGLSEADGTIDFIEFVRDSVLVAHHVGFDVAMVNKALGRLGPVRLYNPLVDTLVLDRRLTRGPMPRDDHHRDEDRSLDGLCTKFGLDIPMRHSAAGDALATAQLLLALLARAERRGIRTLGALLAR